MSTMTIELIDTSLIIYIGQRGERRASPIFVKLEWYTSEHKVIIFWRSYIFFHPVYCIFYLYTS